MFLKILHETTLLIMVQKNIFLLKIIYFYDNDTS